MSSPAPGGESAPHSFEDFFTRARALGGSAAQQELFMAPPNESVTIEPIDGSDEPFEATFGSAAVRSDGTVNMHFKRYRFHHMHGALWMTLDQAAGYNFTPNRREALS